MHALLVARLVSPDVEERWGKLGIAVSQLTPAALSDLLASPQRRNELVADACVLLSDRVTPVESVWTDPFGPDAAVDLAIRLRLLDETVAMPDGRRWSALPIMILSPTGVAHVVSDLVEGLAEKSFSDILAHEISGLDDFGAVSLKRMVKRYRQHLLDELDNLGFIVSYEGGRYRLGPALKPRPELIGYYYFGPADKRPDHFVTLDRDLVGIQLEIELLEVLLNKKDVSEADFQRFFEEHPHFLSQLAMPLPHVQLRDSAGNLLVPDFILKPIVATQRDSRWDVLDLKKPQAKLIVGRGSRRRLSHEVQSAVRQLRDYGDYFADARNTNTVERALGHRLRRPRLGVLIGRINDAEIDALEQEQSRLPDVKIITYDEILGEQKRLVS